MSRWIVLVTVMAPLLGATGCSPNEGEALPAAEEVAAGSPEGALLSAESVQIAGFTTAEVAPTPWRESWRVPGRLTVDQTATEPIGSIVEGRVIQVNAMPGDRVRRGQVLVAIHSHEMMDARAALSHARAQRARAEANLRLAQSAAERGERLLALKALSQAELERLRAGQTDAQSSLEEATAELKRALEFLDHLLGDGPLPANYDEHWVLIRASIDGLVTSRTVQPGNVVLMGAPLLTVSRTSALTLALQLPDAAASAARIGASVRFSVAAFPGESFEARVTRVYPAMDTVSRTVEVHAAVRDARGRLRPEMYAEAEISGSAAGTVLTVPAAAIQSFEGDTVVIASEARGDGMQLSVVPVRVGRRNSALAEILSGIDAGRTVVVQGAAVAKAEILKRRAGS